MNPPPAGRLSNNQVRPPLFFPTTLGAKTPAILTGHEERRELRGQKCLLPTWRTP